MESDERFAILERSIADEKIAAANMKTTLDDLLKRHTEPQNLPTTRPVHANPVVSSSQPVTTSSRLKPGIPSDFDGDRVLGCSFLNSCMIYMRLRSTDFANDQDKIYWVLSYMKSGRTALCVDRTLRYESVTGTPRFPSWSDFCMLFITSFYPQNEPAIARLRLESNLYFQGNRTVDEYCDEFEDLLERSGYVEDLTTVMKFRRGLDRDIQDKITESGVGCLS
jgi:hypothetical protein